MNQNGLKTHSAFFNDRTIHSKALASGDKRTHTIFHYDTKKQKIEKPGLYYVFAHGRVITHKGSISTIYVPQQTKIAFTAELGACAHFLQNITFIHTQGPLGLSLPTNTNHSNFNTVIRKIQTSTGLQMPVYKHGDQITDMVLNFSNMPNPGVFKLTNNGPQKVDVHLQNNSRTTLGQLINQFPKGDFIINACRYLKPNALPLNPKLIKSYYKLSTNEHQLIKKPTHTNRNLALNMITNRRAESMTALEKMNLKKLRSGKFI